MLLLFVTPRFVKLFEPLYTHPKLRGDEFGVGVVAGARNLRCLESPGVATNAQYQMSQHVLLGFGAATHVRPVRASLQERRNDVDSD